MAGNSGGSSSIITTLNEPIKDPESAVTFASNDLDAWKRLYELCIELRNFEISQLVQRNNFFMIFQGVLLAGVCQSAGQIPVVSFMVCFAGLAVSLLQAGMACGAKYWQVHWEVNTSTAESAMTRMLKIHGQIREKIKTDGITIDPLVLSKLQHRQVLIHLFHGDYNDQAIKASLGGGFLKRRLINSLIMCRFSSSRIPIYVGLVLSAVWGVLLVNTIDVPWGVPRLDFISGFSAK
ncbi:hypothetical protein AB9V60_13610 [Pseudomonas syringae pv. atrofaciens]|uniref:RipA family octameric membrane protein n=1 Tax=Pseudomonas syringae TaxID=317 RepID=UPI00351ED362